MNKRRATFNPEEVLEMVDYDDEPMASGSDDYFDDLLEEVVTDDTITVPSKFKESKNHYSAAF